MDFGLEIHKLSDGEYQGLSNSVLNSGIAAVFHALWSKPSYGILWKFLVLQSWKYRWNHSSCILKYNFFFWVIMKHKEKMKIWISKTTGYKTKNTTAVYSFASWPTTSKVKLNVTEKSWTTEFPSWPLINMKFTKNDIGHRNLKPKSFTLPRLLQIFENPLGKLLIIVSYELENFFFWDPTDRWV